MIEAILDVAAIIFFMVATLLFWKLANRLGAKISSNQLILILFGLALILMAIGLL